MPRELILNFHGIGTPHGGVSREERSVWMSRDRFVALIDHVLAASSIAGVPIAITFDDGNASDATIAMPELYKRRLTATFFVCAGRIGAAEYLGPEAISDLLRAGMQIGSHGMHHRDWRTLGDDALGEEMGAARRRLEDVCGAPVTAAAIPFGSYDRRVLGKLRDEGFARVYTSDGGLARPGAWLKARNTLGAHASLEDIERLQTAGRWLPFGVRDVATLCKSLR